MLGAIAHVTAELANDVTSITGVAPPVEPSPEPTASPAPTVTGAPAALAESGGEPAMVWMAGAGLLTGIGAMTLVAVRRRGSVRTE